MNDRILIIGSGLAGITLVRELRKRDKAVEILVVTADDGSFYSKPSLSNAFAAGKAPDALVLATAAKLAQDLDVQIMAGTFVLGIDAARRVVRTSRGELAYGRLVLAVGAAQLPVPLAGDGAPDILAVNDLADYRVLRQRLAGTRTVAIIGAGLIGCEFANDLSLGGYAVTVFDTAAQPLARLLPASAAAALRSRLEAIGVVFRLDTRLARAERAAAGCRLVDAQGGATHHDLVVSAIGLRPNLALAQSAGLATNLGIVTDTFLRTSDPHIHALGDCAEIDGLFLPYVMPIMQGAKRLAATLTGAPEAVELPAMPIVVKTPACPTVVSPPPAGRAGRWEEESGADGLRAVFRDAVSQQALGFVLQGAYTRERMTLAAAMPALRPC
ncbi:FAD-dependent oxidoreductase [Aromatoleum toluvorans]|uniref:FAD-dependent oxidoreductase n=1 Tax=Aromatoleum toluvorans TaxID=92002 RepID=A0ABX1Q3T6_9RHOO|nr:FAD-dependent oxidoreductase [Aromatoleum toluvorans]NMG46028.1 FAD-dependent oxidoreductase [Aromatoleum toluvorans]